MKGHKVLTALGIIILGISLILWQRPIHAAVIHHYVQSSTPTIFVHGWGSGAHAEQKMVNAAQQAGVTRTVVRANVSRQGKVSFDHSIPVRAVNPIVEVNLADNKLSNYQNNYAKGYHRGGTYIKNVILALEKQHHYSAINLVGHSMGNLEIINYINDNRADKSLPKIDHLVAIAGHYNGLVGQKQAEKAQLAKNGKPNWMDPGYKELLDLRQTFPKNIRVLNIYGDIGNGSHSDGDVPVNSAKSLRYLVANRAKSYHELEIHGRKAQHSQLHNNNHQVDNALIKFIWEK